MPSSVNDAPAAAADAVVAVHDHAARMDANYRWQRHFYDATRRYYLFGRDRLLRELAVGLRPGATVVEIGCGTARNLIALARLRPGARLCGLDASAAMLETAALKVARAGFRERITLRQGLAEECDPRTVFGLPRPPDAVFFSYAVSMIPDWQGALLAAWRGLGPGGSLHVVDFWDAAGLPGWCRTGLRAWLARFHTHPRLGLVDFLAKRLPDGGAPSLSVSPVGPRYAVVARVRR